MEFTITVTIPDEMIAREASKYARQLFTESRFNDQPLGVVQIRKQVEEVIKTLDLHGMIEKELDNLDICRMLREQLEKTFQVEAKRCVAKMKKNGGFEKTML